MFKAFKGGEETEGKMDFTLDQLIKETKAISTTTKRFIEIVREIANVHSLEAFYPKFEDESEDSVGRLGARRSPLFSPSTVRAWPAAACRAGSGQRAAMVDCHH